MPSWVDCMMVVIVGEQGNTFAVDFPWCRLRTLVVHSALRCIRSWKTVMFQIMPEVNDSVMSSQRSANNNSNLIKTQALRLSPSFIKSIRIARGGHHSANYIMHIMSFLPRGPGVFSRICVRNFAPQQHYTPCTAHITC